jgi:hypothetical protein
MHPSPLALHAALAIYRDRLADAERDARLRVEREPRRPRRRHR